jgi:hypothetical protein
MLIYALRDKVGTSKSGSQEIKTQNSSKSLKKNLD